MRSVLLGSEILPGRTEEPHALPGLGMHKAYGLGVERQAGRPGRSAVVVIADQRIAQGGQMRPDLVAHPGVQPNADQTVASARLKTGIGGHRFLGSLPRSEVAFGHDDPHALSPPAFGHQKKASGAVEFPTARPPVYPGQIVFDNPAVRELGA